MKILVTSWFGEDFNKNPFSLPANGIGGAEYQTKKLCLALKDVCKVIYVNLGKLNGEYPGLALSFQERSGDYFNLLSSYSKLLTDTILLEKPDLLISYLIYPFGDLVASIVRNIPAPHRPRLATICGSHEWINILEKGQKRQLIAKELVGSALLYNDIFFVRSEYLANEIISRSKATIYRLKPIIEPKLICQTNVSTNSQFLWFGRLTWPKRFDILLSAFKKGVDMNILGDASLTVIGDGDARYQYETEVAGWDGAVRKKIKFLGHIEHENIWSYILESSVTIHLSENEGYGIAPAESLLMGIPTIVSGFPEIVHDFKNDASILSCELNCDSLLDSMEKALKVKVIRRLERETLIFNSVEIAKVILSAAK